MESSNPNPSHVFFLALTLCKLMTFCRDFRMIYAIVISALLSSTAAIELSDAWKSMEFCYIVGPICTSSDVEIWGCVACMGMHGCHDPWIPLSIWESLWWRHVATIQRNPKPIICLGAKGGGRAAKVP